MNKEQVKEAIEVMQHWLDGGEVEVASRGGVDNMPSLNWFLESEPKWDFEGCAYRIKRKPLENYVIYKDGCGIISGHEDYEGAKKYLSKLPVFNGYRIVKMREVEDESNHSRA